MKIALLFLFALAGFVSSQEAPGVVQDAAVHEVPSKADFEAQLEAAGHKLVVVDFYAKWCHPCKLMAPEIEKLAKQLKGEVVFLKVDVDEIHELLQEYKIQAVPTFVFIKNKAVLARLSNNLGVKPSQVKETVERLK